MIQDRDREKTVFGLDTSRYCDWQSELQGALFRQIASQHGQYRSIQNRSNVYDILDLFVKCIVSHVVFGFNHMRHCELILHLGHPLAIRACLLDFKFCFFW